jgi:hypothetical protein
MGWVCEVLSSWNEGNRRRKEQEPCLIMPRRGDAAADAGLCHGFARDQTGYYSLERIRNNWHDRVTVFGSRRGSETSIWKSFPVISTDGPHGYFVELNVDSNPVFIFPFFVVVLEVSCGLSVYTELAILELAYCPQSKQETCLSFATPCCAALGAGCRSDGFLGSKQRMFPGTSLK